MLTRYQVSIIDGIVCIACTSTDYNEPRLITNHWPTTVKARDLADYLGVPMLRLDASEVKESRPGEYYVRNPANADYVASHGMTGAHVLLTEGGRTKPVRTDIADYPAPKNRGKRVEYRGGYWYKDSAKGWKRHESL